MKMEILLSLSMLMMGANQPVVRNLGYEMTKNVRAIFSPRSSSREFTRSACGAMTSWRSRIPDLYISSGRTGRTFGDSVSFFLNKSNSAILFLQRHRLTLFTGIKHLVQQLNRLFGAKLHGAHPRAQEPLLHDGDALLELRDLLFECPIRLFDVRFFLSER